MTDHPTSSGNCAICKRCLPLTDLIEPARVRPSISKLIAEDIADWSDDSRICSDCLQRYRQLVLTNLMADETGELGALESQVAQSLSRNELVTLQTAREDAGEAPGFGARMADHVARWGGSWTFILVFAAVLLGWMLVNTVGILVRPFDPYPYILLNLVLSCVAALQAPIIMMSQRRQEAKDRRRAENDYRINLKAELELRQLHEKIDHQIAHQWGRLLEIQRIQIDLLNEMRHR